MRVSLWEAINDWANAGLRTYGNTQRQAAVVAVEKAVDEEVANLRARAEAAEAEVAELRELLAELLRDWVFGENPNRLTERCRRALARVPLHLSKKDGA